MLMSGSTLVITEPFVALTPKAVSFVGLAAPRKCKLLHTALACRTPNGSLPNPPFSTPHPKTHNTMAKPDQKQEIAGILIEDARLSFDDLWTPTASVEGGTKLKYRANILIDPKTDTGKRNIKKIENLIRQVELAKFNKSPATYKSADRQCFLDGGEFTYKEGKKEGQMYDGYEGMMVLKATNDKRPSVVDRDRTQLQEDDNKVYAGCYCNFFVRIYAVSGNDKGGNGIFSSLECVQFVKDGDAFGGAPVDPEKVFKNLEQTGDSADGEEEEDPLG